MPATTPARSERAVVIDERNMVQLWLVEPVAGRELTEHGLSRDAQAISTKLGHEGDWVRWRLMRL